VKGMRFKIIKRAYKLNYTRSKTIKISRLILVVGYDYNPDRTGPDHAISKTLTGPKVTSLNSGPDQSGS
jgi:hypothetical protein